MRRSVTKGRSRFCLYCVIFFLGVILLPGTNGAQERSDAKIVFLRLHFKDNAITLLGSSVRPGVLKRPRSSRATKEIVYTVHSSLGAELFKSSMEDPSVRRFEYEDPGHPGNILSKQVVSGDVEFTVRIPYHPDNKRLVFERVGKPGTRNEAVSRSVLGTIELPTAGR